MMRREIRHGMFNAQWVMLKGWQDAGRIQGEKLHARASSEGTNCKPERRGAALR